MKAPGYIIDYKLPQNNTNLDEYLKTLKYMIENYSKDALDWNNITETLKGLAKNNKASKCICKTKVESKCYWHGK